MTATAHRLPPLMTVAEFLAWPGDGTATIYELVEGELRAQDAASDGHGTIQNRIAYILTGHLDKTRPNCRVVAAPGVQPNLRSNWNYRVPEIAVTCTSHRSSVHRTPDPILIIEVLSLSNASATWNNVALFSTLPSVTEILVVESERVGAHLLRRGPGATWPPDPMEIGTEDTIRLASVSLDVPLIEIYHGTELGQSPGT